MSDIAESVDYGVTASASDQPVGPKFLRITDIQNGTVVWDNVPWCECDKRSATNARLKSSDIVFARTGATTGKSFLIRDCPADAVFASYLIRVRLGDVAEPRFVSHFFRTPNYWAQITKNARGLAQPGVNATTLKSLKVPLPPLRDQRRIAEILDKADALKAKRRSALAQLDTLTQSIFLDMFGDPATNPKGWVQKCAGRLGTVTTGNTPPRDDPGNYGNAIEWVKSDNLNTTDSYATRALEWLSETGMARGRIVSAGAILVTCIAGSPSAIGNAAMVDRAVAFNQQINAFVPREGNAHFFFAQFAVGKRLVQQASTGGMKGLVSKGRFEKILLMEPPLDLQDCFAEMALRIEGMKSGRHAFLAQMEALYASLQHRAFRGEL